MTGAAGRWTRWITPLVILLVAIVGACSFGKSCTTSSRHNHGSDRVASSVASAAVPISLSTIQREPGASRTSRPSAEVVVAAETGAAARIPFGPGTEKAWNVLDRVTSKGSPLPGYKGGSVFKNAEGRLPGVDGAGNPISYREWDVYPYVKGVDRGAERLVTGSDGAAYYTGDHYGSFLQFWGVP